ncbi:M23 family metallopeptidase [bacterium]|nr:M23 family metallopeptidase [bacterium]
MPLARIYIPRSTYKVVPKQIHEQHPHPKHAVTRYTQKTKIKKKKLVKKKYLPKQTKKTWKKPVQKRGKKFQFLWPVKEPILAKYGTFGEQANGIVNTGIVLKVPKGKPIYASRTGLVMFSGRLKGHGNMVILDHFDNYFSVYMKLGKIKAKKQNVIVKSQSIIGYTNQSDQHNILIFEIKKLNQSVNPLKLLDKNRLKN